MADDTLSSSDSASPHVIRCAECRELVPADRVRHREERIKIVSARAPGRWRAGGAPIFRPTTHGLRLAPVIRPGVQSAPTQRNAYAIERIPVCVDCLRRQKIGVYGVCGIAAACVVVALALYSHEEAPPSAQQVALAMPADSPDPTSGATATTKPALAPAAVQAAPPVEDNAAGSPPVWQPIWDAATSLLSSATSAPAPAQAPAAGPASPPAVLASVPSVTPAAAPTPPADAPAAADSAPAATAPPTDAAEATSTEPPIWDTEHKAARKVAKAAPAARREAPLTSNAVAMRNDGYAALQQRRYRDALTLLQQATMMGDAYAPMYIGQIFENGIGVPRDVGQASYWYGVAINRGNGAALLAFNRMRVNPY